MPKVTKTNKQTTSPKAKVVPTSDGKKKNEEKKIEKRQRTTNEATLEALQQRRAPPPIEIGILRLPAGVESACGIMTQILLHLDIRTVCNVKRSSLIQQCTKAFGCDDFERVRDETVSLTYEGRRGINEIRLSHPARRLYLFIERYKREFPRYTGEVHPNPTVHTYAFVHDYIPTPFVCACEHGRINDVKLFVHLHPYHKYITNRDVNGGGVNQEWVDDMTLKDFVSLEGTASTHPDDDEPDMTPLMAAVRNKHFHVVRYLIEECEADPNIANGRDWNALLIAIWMYENITDTEVIELLLNHMSVDGINQEVENRGGFAGDRRRFTALDWWYWENNNPDEEIIRVSTLLRSKGAVANVHDENGVFVSTRMIEITRQIHGHTLPLRL